MRGSIADETSQQKRTRVRLLEKPLKLMMEQCEPYARYGDGKPRQEAAGALYGGSREDDGRVGFEEELKNIDVCRRSQARAGQDHDLVTTLRWLCRWLWRRELPVSCTWLLALCVRRNTPCWNTEGVWRGGISSQAIIHPSMSLQLQMSPAALAQRSTLNRPTDTDADQRSRCHVAPELHQHARPAARCRSPSPSGRFCVPLTRSTWDSQCARGERSRPKIQIVLPEPEFAPGCTDYRVEAAGFVLVGHHHVGLIFTVRILSDFNHVSRVSRSTASPSLHRLLPLPKYLLLMHSLLRMDRRRHSLSPHNTTESLVLYPHYFSPFISALFGQAVDAMGRLFAHFCRWPPCPRSILTNQSPHEDAYHRVPEPKLCHDKFLDGDLDRLHLKYSRLSSPLIGLWLPVSPMPLHTTHSSQSCPV